MNEQEMRAEIRKMQREQRPLWRSWYSHVSRDIQPLYRDIFAPLLKYGRSWVPGPFPPAVPRGRAKACFRNALELVLGRPLELTYVEGYAWNGGIPFRHAWSVDPAGYVIDPTWGYHETLSYWGIPLRLEYLQKVFAESPDGWGGVLDREHRAPCGFCAPLMTARPQEFLAPRTRGRRSRL